jgi:hypothetical protein
MYIKGGSWPSSGAFVTHRQRQRDGRRPRYPQTVASRRDTLPVRRVRERVAESSGNRAAAASGAHRQILSLVCG